MAAAQYDIIAVLRKLMGFLPNRMRSPMKWVILASCAVALTETLALGSVAFFVSSVTNPDAFLSTSVYQKISEFFPGITSYSAQDVLVVAGIATLVLLAGKSLVKFGVDYACHRFTGNVTGYLGTLMLNGIMRMPYQWLANENSGDLVTAVQRTRNCIGLLVCFFRMISDCLLILLMVAMLLVANPKAILIALVSVGLPAFALFRLIRPKVKGASATIASHDEVGNRNLMTALQGLRDVKIYAKEDSFLHGFSSRLYATVDLKAKVAVLREVPGGALEVVGFSMLFGVSLYMYHAAHSSVMVTGTLALLAVAAWRVLPAIVRIVSSITVLGALIPAVQFSLKYLDKVAEAAHSASAQEGGKAITFDNVLHMDKVSFAYENGDGYVLDALDFFVNKGEMVGVVGRSGAGKSTLMDILIGLLPPSTGRVLADGQVLNDKEHGGVAGLFGYVPQSPYIYDATLAENVAFGFHGDGIDRDRVQKACEQAAVSEFLPTLSDGLDTMLGERGVRLSGGQQQRICIARALYLQPDFLVFDEATSSLDTLSEQKIKQTIMNLKGCVTMVVVAHRLSTVEECDTVIWLENGVIRQTGSPAEVLPAYRQALKLDAGESGEAEEERRG